MRIRLHEPAVALTDLAIGVEAGAFAIALARAASGDGGRTTRAAAARRWFVVFFGATSLAAIAGAALHGLVADPRSPAGSGCGACRSARSGSPGCPRGAWRRSSRCRVRPGVRVRRLAGVVHAAYLVGLARTNPPFAVAIGTYLPGALALGAGLVARLRAPGERAAAAIALAGLGLTFGAAAAQPRKIAVHPRLFDHNATYHTIQALAIACFYAAPPDRFIRR